MKRIDRYILTKVLWPFIGAQAVFVVMFIGTEALTEATKLIARYGLPWHGVIGLLLLRIPWAIGWTMPMSVGMAVILAVGGICKDTEYTPMVVGGMSYRRMLVPLLGFALAISSVAYWIEEYAGPKTMMMYWTKKLQLQNQATAQQFEVHLRLTESDSPKRITLDAGMIFPTTRTMNQVAITFWEKDQLPKGVIYAKVAQYEPKKRAWMLHDACALRLDPQGRPQLVTYWKETDVRQAAGESGFGNGLVFESSPNQIAVAASEKPDYFVYSEIRRRLAEMERMNFSRRELNRVKVHIHRRSTLSFSCIVFLIIGGSLAVRPQRGQSLGTAFALGVGLLLSYYILWNATCFLGEGVAYPGLICWSTNIAGLAIGTW
ncbi:MAG: LptF/LptG family permease, partial [Armatimonadetes bacterium]|nr:LptF/LptG family permease [Armatimonadota bacterium]